MDAGWWLLVHETIPRQQNPVLLFLNGSNSGFAFKVSTMYKRFDRNECRRSALIINVDFASTGFEEGVVGSFRTDGIFRGSLEPW
jgi:hypothetical protein